MHKLLAEQHFTGARNRHAVARMRRIARFAAAMTLSISSITAGLASAAPVFDKALGNPATADRRLAAHAQAVFHDPHTQSLGNPHGDVTIVEFFDYACPFCKAAEPRLEALLKTDHGVRLVVKEFPVLSPASAVASKAALAAVAQGRYAAFHQALLNHKGSLDDDVIFEIAKDEGLDVARLRRDMNAPWISAEIAADLALARVVGVPGTPTFIAGGQILTQPSADIDFAAVAAAARRR